MTSRLTAAVVIVAALGAAVACGQEPAPKEPAPEGAKDDGADSPEDAAPAPGALVQMTVGGGCFWCVEAVFERVDGVHGVVSGYAGGHVDDPTYAQVCGKETGHAEVCQIEYDPSVVSYVQLLKIFFKTHDPTTLDRQGNDVGPQYRSVIFYHDDTQKKLAEELKSKLDASGAWDVPIVTEIAEYMKMWPAEDYHQDFYEKNPEQGYCNAVIPPKLAKLEKVFGELLKKEKGE